MFQAPSRHDTTYRVASGHARRPPDDNYNAQRSFRPKIVSSSMASRGGEDHPSAPAVRQSRRQRDPLGISVLEPHLSRDVAATATAAPVSHACDAATPNAAGAHDAIRHDALNPYERKAA
jgi:hypothetical protein